MVQDNAWVVNRTVASPNDLSEAEWCNPMISRVYGAHMTFHGKREI